MSSEVCTTGLPRILDEPLYESPVQLQQDDWTITSSPTSSVETLQSLDTGLSSLSTQDEIIAVMGATGAGKSSFINIATGQTCNPVGHGLISCTRDIRAVGCRHPDGTDRNIVFVDTPGFDDTTISDADILNAIAAWLTATYKKDILLSGLLFLHRISDNRMAGTPLRNLSMFEKLCGPDALQNVVLATTMWGDVDEEAGSKREDELKSSYWKPMLDAGSKISRFYYSYESAWAIINQFSGTRRKLQLQDEMVDQGKDLSQTAAGAALFRWFNDLIAAFKDFIRKFETRLRKNMLEDERRKYESTKVKLKQAEDQRRKLYPHGNRSSISDRLHRSRLFSVAQTNMPGRANSLDDNSRRREVPCPIVELESHEHRRKLMGLTITALQHSRDLVSACNVPFLPGLVDLILTIAQSIKNMSEANHTLFYLANNAGELVSAITRQLNKRDVSEDMKLTIIDLFNELENVQGLINRIMSQGHIAQYVFQAADDRVIAECDRKVRMAYERFGIIASINADAAMVQMDANINRIGANVVQMGVQVAQINASVVQLERAISRKRIRRVISRWTD